MEKIIIQSKKIFFYTFILAKFLVIRQITTIWTYMMSFRTKTLMIIGNEPNLGFPSTMTNRLLKPGSINMFLVSLAKVWKISYKTMISTRESISCLQTIQIKLLEPSSWKFFGWILKNNHISLNKLQKKN